MLYEVLSLALPEMKPELLTNSIRFEKENVQVVVCFSKNNYFQVEVKVNEESIYFLKKRVQKKS